jgi:hypothetical protein
MPKTSEQHVQHSHQCHVSWLQDRDQGHGFMGSLLATTIEQHDRLEVDEMLHACPEAAGAETFTPTPNTHTSPYCKCPLATTYRWEMQYGEMTGMGRSPIAGTPLRFGAARRDTHTFARGVQRQAA